MKNKFAIGLLSLLMGFILVFVFIVFYVIMIEKCFANGFKEKQLYTKVITKKSGATYVISLSKVERYKIYSGKRIVFDLQDYSWYAFDEDDFVVNSGDASGGRKYCPDIKKKCKTPIGEFKVISKKGPWYRSPLYPLNCDNKSKKNKCALMRWAVKFRQEGESIHGGVKGKIKQHVSHGCIHVSDGDAKWLNSFLNIGDKILIYDYK